MREPEYRARMEAVQLVRREIFLASSSAMEAHGASDPHMVWHFFRSSLRDDSDVHLWADQIEHVLIPALRAADDLDWNKLAFYVGLLVQELRWLDPTEYYNCPRCF